MYKKLPPQTLLFQVFLHVSLYLLEIHMCPLAGCSCSFENKGKSRQQIVKEWRSEEWGVGKRIMAEWNEMTEGGQNYATK